MPAAKRLFFSLDRQTAYTTDYIEPDRYVFLERLSKLERYIPRGAGLSYVAASFATDSVSVGLSKFNRILSFDIDQDLITVEAGISLHKLHLFLAPRGLAVPVEPGHPQITIGGCIAFNVCGKNQHKEGLFESCLEELELFHPKKGLVRCSRSMNKELFELTVGGMGLTGIILKATLRLKKIPSPWLTVEKIAFRNLHEMVGVMKKRSDTADTLHSYNDFSTFGSNLGRGFVSIAHFTQEVAPAEFMRSFKRMERRSSSLPSFYNKITVPLFSLAYTTLNTVIRPTEMMPFYKYNYPVADISFYFDWYGKRGFVERQMLVPNAQIEHYIERFETLLRKHRPLVVLGSCKLFSGTRRHLHFAGSGIVISIDTVPKNNDVAFHQALDELNVSTGTIDNISKDSRITRDLIESEYAAYKTFREAIAQYDPERRLASALSEKLHL